MSLTTKEIAELKKIVARANELIAKSNGRETGHVRQNAPVGQGSGCFP